jgi:hypothetical protein
MKHTELIVRNVGSASRMIEIISSMRAPLVAVRDYIQDGIPSMTVTAINENGVCNYVYKVSGTIEVANDKELFKNCKYRIKPTQWKMEPAEWIIGHNGQISKTDYAEITNTQRFGMKLHTKEQAEKARDQMRDANLLRYWVSTMQSLDEGTAFIYEEDGNYYYSLDNKRVDIGKVYMKEETAKRICDALEKGELVLREPNNDRG